MTGEHDAVIPITVSASSRTAARDTPTFRYNPKTGVGSLSLAAWHGLGRPSSVGVWYSPLRHRVLIDPDPTPDLARKLSPKRTFSLAGLRSYVQGGPQSWELHKSESKWYFDLEKGM